MLFLFDTMKAQPCYGYIKLILWLRYSIKTYTFNKCMESRWILWISLKPTVQSVNDSLGKV